MKFLYFLLFLSLGPMISLRAMPMYGEKKEGTDPTRSNGKAIEEEGRMVSEVDDSSGSKARGSFSNARDRSISADAEKGEMFFPQEDLCQAQFAVLAWEQERVHLEGVDPFHLDLEEEQVIALLEKAEQERDDWNERKDFYEAASIDDIQKEKYLAVALACQQAAEKINEVEILYDGKILPIKSMGRVRRRILNLTQGDIFSDDDGPHVIYGAILAELLSQPSLRNSRLNKESQAQKISSSSLERSREIRQGSWKVTGWRVAKAVLIGAGYITNSELLKASSNLQQWQETRIKPLCRQLLAHSDIFSSLETRFAKALECARIEE